MARAERLAATASVESLKDKQYALGRQIEDQQREIAEQQQRVKSTPPPKPNEAQGISAASQGRTGWPTQGLRHAIHRKEPKVAQTRNQLAEVNRQLEQLSAAAEAETGQAETTEARELRGLQRDLSRLQTELEVTHRELNRRSASLTDLLVAGPSAAATPLPAEGNSQSGMDKMAYLQNRYVSLLDKLDRLQMALSAPIERGLAPFRVVDPPNLPLAPSGPNRDKLKLIALALALAVGLGVAVMIEGPRCG